MREMRLSTYSTYQEFVEGVEFFDKGTAQQLANLAVHDEWKTDIIVRFFIGRVEIVIEKDFPPLTFDKLDEKTELLEIDEKLG